MTEPDLACILLSHGNPPELLDAVRSLTAATIPLEIVVVNSGGGDAAKSIAEAGFAVRVINVAERLLPGGARNRGIAGSRAPYLAFLACDCTAAPGWAEERLRLHRSGRLAVASAITNPFPRNLAAWASHVALYAYRMPGLPAERALRFGGSYARSLFEQFGLFREDLRGAEDTEFHRRLGSLEIVWAPAVRTAHRHPTTIVQLLTDQYRRGRRSAIGWRKMNGHTPWFVARNAILRSPRQFVVALRHAAADERKWIVTSAFHFTLAVLSYAAGAAAEALRSGNEPIVDD